MANHLALGQLTIRKLHRIDENIEQNQRLITREIAPAMLWADTEEFIKKLTDRGLEKNRFKLQPIREDFSKDMGRIERVEIWKPSGDEWRCLDSSDGKLKRLP